MKTFFLMASEFLKFIVPKTVARSGVFTRSGLGQKTVFRLQTEILRLRHNILFTNHN